MKEWLTVLEPFFRAIYYKILQINPADRPVVILENRYWPFIFKEALVSILFDKKHKLGAPSLLFLSNEAVPIYATGQSNGLVIDVGYLESRVSPICHGVPLPGCYRNALVGMKDVHAKFEASLNTDASFKTTENMIVRTCVVSPMGQEAKIGDVQYPFLNSEGKKQVVTIPAAVRCNSSEALFGDNHPEEFNVAHLTLDCLLKCNVDQRALVVSNIILCGGTTHLPGFGSRLVQEIYSAMDLPKYKSLKGMKGKFSFFKSPYPNNIVQWIGGAVVGSLDLTDSYYEKQEWEDRPIPDWSAPQYAEDELSSDSESDEGDLSDEGDEGDEPYIDLGGLY